MVIEPMRASLAEDPPLSGDWATEIKWDGVRAISFCDDGDFRLQGRQLNDLTGLFPEIRPLAGETPPGRTVLDGELVAFDEDGIPDFQSIQNRVKRPVELPPQRSYLATFVIFDLLFANGADLRDQPYSHRRAVLEAMALNGPCWQTPGYLEVDIATTLEVAARQGLEGLVVKRLTSPYSSGTESGDWLKLKNGCRQEFVIGGWLPKTGEAEKVPGALLVGYWDHNPERGQHLRYAGQITAGFSDGDLETIVDDLQGFGRLDCPFEGMPEFSEARFVNPLRVVEAEFDGWCEDSRIKNPAFIGMRRDKDPGDVRREGSSQD